MTGLFRPEAVAHRRQRGLGAVRRVRPGLSAGAVAAVLAVAAGLVVLGSSAGYTPRLRVGGTIFADPRGGRLVATLAVPARSADRVHIGQTLHLRLPGSDQGRWPGKVVQVSPVPLSGNDKGVRTVRVELSDGPRPTLDDPTLRAAGRPVEAELTGGRRRVLDSVIALVRSMQPSSREGAPAT